MIPCQLLCALLAMCLCLAVGRPSTTSDHSLDLHSSSRSVYYHKVTRSIDGSKIATIRVRTATSRAKETTVTAGGKPSTEVRTTTPRAKGTTVSTEGKPSTEVRTTTPRAKGTTVSTEGKPSTEVRTTTPRAKGTTVSTEGKPSTEVRTTTPRAKGTTVSTEPSTEVRTTTPRAKGTTVSTEPSTEVRTTTPRAKGTTVSTEGNDPTGSPSKSTKGPLKIGENCSFPAQCQKLHPNSTCSQTQGNVSTCVCPQYPSADNTTCIEAPKRLGDVCSQVTQCTDRMVNTDCSDATCQCAAGHLAFLNRTGCHPDPRHLGDYCLKDSNCLSAVDNSICEVTNNTCICVYGYYQRTATSCQERDRLGEYKPVAPEPSINCSTNKCEAWNNSICQKVNDDVSVCRCDYRHARKPGDIICVPVQTYQINLTIFQEAGKYDYISLKYEESRFSEIAHRVTLLGIQKIFEASQFSERYVSSDVVDINRGRDDHSAEVKVTVLLHLTAFYLNATKVNPLKDTILSSLISSNPVGILGESLLKIWNPYSSVIVEDYDECAEKERNDCSKDANCLNTLGSFMCICKPYFVDNSIKTFLRPGRNCSKREENNQDNDASKCSSGICATSVGYTILALALFLLIVIIFITYEIIQRKQDFSARKLYEKFGTTKIRKLRQASMRRLQGSKRKKKEEKMKKKELAKKKKEEVKAEENKEKKMKKMSRKESKNKKGNKSENIEELNENKDATDEQPVNIVYPPSLPFVDDETVNADICNLPGSVNAALDERLSRYVPYIEESPV